jgi:hypothetical protein
MQKLIYQEELTYRFHPNETENIRFVVHGCNTGCLYYDSWVTVFFTGNQETERLACDVLYEKISNLFYLLEKSLNQENKVDEQHIPDIGLFFNEMHYKKSMLYETISSNELYKHVVWSPIFKWGDIQTWLYSNTHGETILFLAPVYPFFHTKRENQHASYTRWMKTYKPFARRIISRDIAEKWLKQAGDIINLIETNSATRSEELAKEQT